MSHGNNLNFYLDWVPTRYKYVCHSKVKCGVNLDHTTLNSNNLASKILCQNFHKAFLVRSKGEESKFFEGLTRLYMVSSDQATSFTHSFYVDCPLWEILG